MNTELYVVTHKCTGWDLEEDSSFKVLGVFDDRSVAFEVGDNFICAHSFCDTEVDMFLLNEPPKQVWCWPLKVKLLENVT